MNVFFSKFIYDSILFKKKILMFYNDLLISFTRTTLYNNKKLLYVVYTQGTNSVCIWTDRIFCKMNTQTCEKILICLIKY